MIHGFVIRLKKKKYYNDEHFMILEIDNPNDFDKTLELIKSKLKDKQLKM